MFSIRNFDRTTVINDTIKTKESVHLINFFQMKQSNYCLLIFICFISIACQHRVKSSVYQSRPILDYKEEVIVLPLYQSAPEDALVIGEVRIGDSGFSTNCGYDIAIEKAKLEARKLGGNAVKITEHKTPSPLSSTCHRIKAIVLYLENAESIELTEEIEPVIEGVDYAILNIYRPRGIGPLVSYDLYLGDSAIYRVKNRQKTTLYIKKEGYNSLWAKTESKTEIPINIKVGHTYYLRCSVTMGAIVGRPSLELVDSKTGKLEFNAM